MIDKGDIWTISGDECIGKWVKETGRLDHDAWLFDKLSPLVNKCGVCADIGAYIGDHTIRYAQWFDKVYAYEPNIQAYACLVHNCPFSHVYCINSAVGPKHLQYSLKIDEKNPGASHLCENGDNLVYFADLPRNETWNFLKIDVEGFELTVLMACEDIIARDRPQMLIEQREKDGNEKLVRAFLDKYNYKYSPIQGKTGEQYDLWCECGGFL